MCIGERQLLGSSSDQSPNALLVPYAQAIDLNIKTDHVRRIAADRLHIEADATTELQHAPVGERRKSI
jgi:formate-dependent phosphoribosylglycinamide formyltransferase (GAR transformylase)